MFITSAPDKKPVENQADNGAMPEEHIQFALGVVKENLEDGHYPRIKVEDEILKKYWAEDMLEKEILYEPLADKFSDAKPLFESAKEVLR